MQQDDIHLEIEAEPAPPPKKNALKKKPEFLLLAVRKNLTVTVERALKDPEEDPEVKRRAKEIKKQLKSG